MSANPADNRVNNINRPRRLHRGAGFFTVAYCRFVRGIVETDSTFFQTSKSPRVVAACTPRVKTTTTGRLFPPFWVYLPTAPAYRNARLTTRAPVEKLSKTRLVHYGYYNPLYPPRLVIVRNNDIILHARYVLRHR